MCSPMVAIRLVRCASTVLPKAGTWTCFSAATSSPWASAALVTPVTNSWNLSLRATKSVSLLTSTAAPTLPAVCIADQAFGSDAAGLLGGRGEALLAQPVDGLLDIAGDFGQRALAIHHAGAGLLAQVLDQGGGDLCHVGSPEYRINRLPAPTLAGRRCIIWSPVMQSDRHGPSAESVSIYLRSRPTHVIRRSRLITILLSPEAPGASVDPRAGAVAPSVGAIRRPG